MTAVAGEYFSSLLVLNMNNLPVQQVCGLVSDIDDNQSLPVGLLHGSRKTVYSSIPACCQAMMIPLSQICLISVTANIGLVSLLDKMLSFLPEQRKTFTGVNTGALISTEVLMPSETFVPPDAGISSVTDESAFALSSAEKHADHTHQFVLKNI